MRYAHQCQRPSVKTQAPRKGGSGGGGSVVACQSSHGMLGSAGKRSQRGHELREGPQLVHEGDEHQEVEDRPRQAGHTRVSAPACLSSRPPEGRSRARW